ncbi:MAG: transcription initiation factor IIB [Halobacteria archaeon]
MAEEEVRRTPPPPSAGEGPPSGEGPKVANRITECPECSSPQIRRDYQRGEMYCSDCGLVVDESIIDTGPEWSAYDAEQRAQRARSGAPLTLTIHDKGLTTEIDWRNRDARGQELRNREQFYRLRKMQRRARVSSAAERNLAFALSEIDRMSSSLGLSRNIREKAAVLYRKTVDKGLIRGRSIEAVAAATLYASCRGGGIPRTLDEVAAVARVSRKDIARAYRLMARELELKLAPVSSTDYIDRFCSELHLEHEIRRKALDLLNTAREKKLLGAASPDGMAAASIYIASLLADRAPPQRELARVAGVSEVTIRNRYKELALKLGLDLGPRAA